MKTSHLALILFGILFSFLAFAEHKPIQPQTQGDVTFVTGGVGFEEQAELQAMRSDYNLSLLFSIQRTGDYLSDVKISITDLRGNTFLETVSEGPELFAKLPSGRYIVNVEFNGIVFHKTILVRAGQNTSLSFIWPEEMENQPSIFARF
jgi:hypothetical protein